MDDISPEQTETLLQFQDLTRIDELDRCKEILTRYNWNLELAVQDTFNRDEGHQEFMFNHPGEIQTREQQTRELTRPVPLMIFHPRQRIFRTSTLYNRNQGWIPWFKWLFSAPFSLTLGTVFELVSFFYRLFVPDPRSRLTDPYGDVRKFIDEFETKYGLIHPDFERSTYSQVLQKAKEEFRFIVILLTDDKDENCAEFHRNCLLNPDVSQFINTHSLFWACSTETPEGFRVANIMRSRSQPFMAVVGLRENKLTVLARFEGKQDPTEFVARLQSVFDENERFFIAARQDAEDRNVNRRLRVEQDDAFLQSLKADQEKMRQKKEAEQEKVKKEQEILNKRKMNRALKRDRRALKETIRNSFLDEPETNNDESIPLAFKLPSGERINRRFLSTDSLRIVRNFVFCQPTAPNKFEIMKSFPRKTLPNPDNGDEKGAVSENVEDVTISDLGLAKNELLFVQRLSDSESDCCSESGGSTDQDPEQEGMANGDGGVTSSDEDSVISHSDGEE